MKNGPGGHSKRGSHRLSQVSICPRQWYFRWALGLSANEQPYYFTEGTLVHIALAYYRAQQLHERGLPVPSWFFERTMQDCLAEAGKGAPDAVQLGLSVFSAYGQRYASHDPWEPISMETEFEASLGEIRRLTQPDAPPRADDDEVVSSRIDLVVRTNGYLWAADYKTTKKSYKDKLSRFNFEGEYAVNFQFLLQCAILRVRLGSEFRGIAIERILKSTPHDFDRTAAPLSNAFFRALPDTLSMLTAQERELGRSALAAQARGEDMYEWLPVAHPWACYSGGSPCQYRPLCTAEDAGQRKETVVREYHTAE